MLCDLRVLTRLGMTTGATLAAIAVTAAAGRTAEQVIWDFGVFSRTVSVDTLEDYLANSVEASLAADFESLPSEQSGGFLAALTLGNDADVVTLSRWYYAPMGERTLLFLGNLLPTGARINGQQALRSALIAAASEDSDTSLLDIVQHYPTEVMRVDIALGQQIARQVIDEAESTLAVVEIAKQISTAAAAAKPLPDLSALPDPTQAGPHAVRQIELMLQDSTREDPIFGGPRRYPATVFVPEDLGSFSAKLPVIVMSHGLADTRSSFFDVASHLASHGFAVALPDHIGSNGDYRAALFAGLTHDYFAASDFLNRPLDITFLLDELARTNVSQYAGKLNLEQVAIAGHSFGGYTALALGGATVDFARLTERCDPDANILLNGAMVLECRALELLNQPEVVQQLGQTGVADERVKLVMAFAPVSNLFGERGIRQIQRPVMIQGGAFDILAPIVPQQLLAFSWLTTPDKYFYLAENTSHSAEFTGLTNRLFNLDEQFEQSVLEAGLGINRNLNKALIVAFSQVYLEGRSEYEPFLTAAYVEETSQPPFNFRLLREVADIPMSVSQ
jgi:predicted dienelactone hydrolase